ncbi:MAG: hypothetical protein JRG91_04205 [Deltaproteobacteria bacterium]|nr:hypothetical protein [Deltaproteobacteria bacterium]
MAVSAIFLAITSACDCGGTEILGSTDAGNSEDASEGEPPCGYDVPTRCHAALEYMADPCPQPVTLAFSANLKRADVYFSLDSSLSMAGEIMNLRTSLRDVVVPGVRAEIPDVWFGIGRFEDCMECAHNMVMIEPVTNDIARIEAALHAMSDLCGGNEPYTQNLYAIATGDVAPFAEWGGVEPASWTCTPPGAIGWPCFRTDAIPIIVQTGDESFIEALGSCSPAIDHAQTISALNSISAKYIGVNSGESALAGRDDMVIIAEGTGSVAASGNPLVFDIPRDGSGLGSQVVEAIAVLSRNVPVDITAVPRDDPSDDIDALTLIDHVEPDSDGGIALPEDHARICPGGLPVTDADDDTILDTFSSVLGSAVCFDVHLRRNETIPALSSHQEFRFLIDVIADGVTVLDTREVVLCVPGY